ncbi:MAG TPA: ribonuclease H [Kofleriaceae bacterium]|jgi:ribonuclease HI|nr:ribonuclease H [Kofleriaceae bacterium]
MPWIKRLLRGKEVFARADRSGKLRAGSDGRVDVIYNPVPGSKIYRASAGNLEATGDPADDKPLDLEIETPPDGGAVVQAGTAAESIIVYTDGACHGNPGPMGIGVVILDRGQRREVSEFLGEGTNNIAELTAILRALELIPPADRERPVLVHSDSSYALGLLSKGWKPKKNVELVDQLRREAVHFPRLRAIKVAGHAGVSENERCDQLANAAVIARR